MALMLLSSAGGCASRGTPASESGESRVAGHLEVTGADSSGDRGGNARACNDEAREPNDTLARAAALPAEGPLLSSTCTGDEAFFRFDSPVPRGSVFQVIVESLQAPDELGVVVASLETGERNWSQSPFEDGRQVIGVVSDGGAYSVRVQVVSASVDETASVHFYTLSVVAAAPAKNGCCSTSTGPGCADALTLSCLCQSDDDCCSRPYDALCVSEAMSLCGLRCEGEAAPSDCCSVSAAPGCQQDDVEACVCGIDPYCCVGFFDDNCVRLAENQCGTACPRAQSNAP